MNEKEARRTVASLPVAQRRAMAVLALQHPVYTWHMNACGCCLCFHPDRDTSRGWIINSDGDAFYEEAPHGAA